MIMCEFDRSVPVREIEDVVTLAMAAGESLHGAPAVRLGAGVFLDRKRRTCAIETQDPAGDSIARVFTGFAALCFGAEAFRVRRLAPTGASAPIE